MDHNMLVVKLRRKVGLCPKEVEERAPNLENVPDVERDTKKDALKNPQAKEAKEVEKADF
jgi:hypothetical protein